MARKPSIRQKKAVENMVVDGGSDASALRKAGYSEAIAKNPQKVTQSPIFQELVKKYLPDSLLLKVHTEGLEAMKVVSARAKSKKSGEPFDADEDTDDFIEVPDHPTRHKFLVTAYEVADKIKPKDQGSFPVQVNVLIQQSLEKIYGSPTETPTSG